MKAFAIFPLVLVPASLLFAASDSQTVTLDHKLQIPGATLKRGDYTFEIEDRLQDRAIIRITDAKKKSHELVLAVPNEKLNQDQHGKLIFFPTENADKQILEGWMCPSCQTALQVVYPKAEAAKITGVSAKPVLAVDPTYDKLPKNLSPDDMKVVTLWLLSPKEVTADQKGKGLDAAKWADVGAPKKTEVAEAKPAVPATESASNGAASQPSSTTAPAETPAASSQTAAVPTSSPAPVVAQAEPAPVATPVPSSPVPSPSVQAAASSPVQVASSSSTETASATASSSTNRRMPHTASNTFTFGLIGLALLGSGLALRLQRKLEESASK